MTSSTTSAGAWSATSSRTRNVLAARTEQSRWQTHRRGTARAHARAVPQELLYLTGGQCGLLLPVAPRHCLSPGPGASAHAVGAEMANVSTASSPTISLFGLLMRHLLSLSAVTARELPHRANIGRFPPRGNTHPATARVERPRVEAGALTGSSPVPPTSVSRFHSSERSGNGYVGSHHALGRVNHVGECLEGSYAANTATESCFALAGVALVFEPPAADLSRTRPLTSTELH